MKKNGTEGEAANRPDGKRDWKNQGERIRLPLLWQGEFAGTVEVDREPLYLRFRVLAPARAGLWCVWLLGGEDEARLGVLEPLDGQFSLVRRVSLRSLAPLGRLDRCEVRPADGTRKPPSVKLSQEALSQEAPDDGITPPRSLRRLAAETGGTLFRTNGGILLAVPQGERFPLPALFCFARADYIGGRAFWVFPFDTRGRPVF